MEGSLREPNVSVIAFAVLILVSRRRSTSSRKTRATSCSSTCTGTLQRITISKCVSDGRKGLLPSGTTEQLSTAPLLTLKSTWRDQENGPCRWEKLPTLTLGARDGKRHLDLLEGLPELRLGRPDAFHRIETTLRPVRSAVCNDMKSL